MSWAKLSIANYIELNELKLDDFEDDFDFKCQQLSIILDLPIADIYSIPYNEFDEFYLKTTQFLKTVPSIKKWNKNLVVANDIKLSLLDFQKITLGEFIDLENLLTQDFYKNFGNILAILYRIYEESPNPLLYNPKIEKYGDWIFLRANLFMDFKIETVYGAIYEYLEFRKLIFEKYEGLFDSNSTEEGEEEEIDTKLLTGQERNKLKKYEDTQKTIKKWGWDILIYRLVNGDFSKLESITEISLLGALNALSMAKELEI